MTDLARPMESTSRKTTVAVLALVASLCLVLATPQVGWAASSRTKPTKIRITNTAGKVVATGQAYQLKYKLSSKKPLTRANKRVRWTSNNSRVVSVSRSGKLRAKANGTATITAKTVNGKKAKYKIVVGTPVSGVRVSGPSFVLIGGTASYTCGVSPASATRNRVTYRSSNTAVATVDSAGLLRAKQPGKTTLTASSTDGSGKQATLTVTVVLPAASVRVSGTSFVAIGKTSGYRAVVSPSTALQRVAWKSSDPAVATIAANGVLTGKKAGRVTLTATAADGTGRRATIGVSVGSAWTGLRQGDRIGAGQSLRSPNGQYLLSMKTDGNLALTVATSTRVLWQTKTTNNSGASAVLQAGDGNFVVYSNAGKPLWNAGTAGKKNVRLEVQNDGRVVLIFDGGSKALCNANSMLKTNETLRKNQYLYSTNLKYQLIMQSDGNLVLYQVSPKKALWSINKYGTDNYAVLQADGNFVVYSGAKKALWATATNGKSEDRLTIQTDGNLVLYATNGTALWASHTVQSPTPPSGGVIGDDYPYKNAPWNPSNAASNVDPWNFVCRNCTSFVAWRLNNANKVSFTNQYQGVHWGNAGNWGNAAQAVGITVNNTPRRGAVAWNSGHVAWVAAVNSNGTIVVEEYNWYVNYQFDGKYHTQTVPTSDYQYIHIKDL